jgi:TPP-dependent pyruvate/acetoin dehydrogenase alpha subunit
MKQMRQHDENTLLSLYRMSRLIRRVEEVLIDEYARQEMRCPMHFCIGQEGAPTALSPLLRSDDYLVSHYRSHGYYLAKGAPLTQMIAEFYGKASGANGGTAGSMELAHDDSRFFSGAIVGGLLPIAMGMAFALKYRNEDAIAIAAIGDGALDEGVSYEALNLAALHGAPLLTICENNLYAAHTPESKRTLSRSLTARVEPFGLRTMRLDGCDIPRLHADLGIIIGEMRSQSSGPYFVEIETYRYCSHVGPENDDWLEYRSKKEIAAWRRRDPVQGLRDQLKRLDTSEDVLRDIEQCIERDLSAAIDAAKRAPFPTYDWSLAQVWAESYAPIVKHFSNPHNGAFDSRQAETRLKPY